jgi:hypothetical protein
MSSAFFVVFSTLIQILTFLQFGGCTLARNSSDLFQSFGFDTQPVPIGLIIFQVLINETNTYHQEMSFGICICNTHVASCLLSSASVLISSFRSTTMIFMYEMFCIHVCCCCTFMFVECSLLDS